jgi:hypothetical protein
MERRERGVSKIKPEAMTVCLLELGGKLDAVGVLCDAPNVRLRARDDGSMRIQKRRRATPLGEDTSR